MKFWNENYQKKKFPLIIQFIKKKKKHFQDSPTINYNESGSTDPLQPQLNSPPSQSSTLKLGTDTRKTYQTPPLLYDALNRHDISRYDPLGLNINYDGSNSTLSSGGSVGNTSLTNNASSSLLQSNLANGHYTNHHHHHHTLPHPSAVIQHQPPVTTHTLGSEQLSISDYLTASSLIDYNLSKSSAGMISNVGGGTNGLNAATGTAATNAAVGHMTLPKSLALGSMLGANSVPHATTSSSNSTLTPSKSNCLTVTQKTNASRNHIITDTLPGPESCV